MLKPLTLSLSLAVALGASSVSMAGLFDGHHGAMASPQGVIASPQEILPSAQCDTGGCGDVCAPGRSSAISSASCTGPSATATLGPEEEADPRPPRRLRGCGGGCDTCDTRRRLSFGPVRQPAGLRQRPGLRLVADLRQRPGLLRAQRPGLRRRQRPGLRRAARPMVPASLRPADRPAPGPGRLTPAPAGDEAPPAPEVPRPRPRKPRPPRPPRTPRPPTLPRAACSSRPRRATEHPARGPAPRLLRAPRLGEVATGETNPSRRPTHRDAWAVFRCEIPAWLAIDKPRRLWITHPSQDATGPAIPGRGWRPLARRRGGRVAGPSCPLADRPIGPFPSAFHALTLRGRAESPAMAHADRPRRARPERRRRGPPLGASGSLGGESMRTEITSSPALAAARLRAHAVRARRWLWNRGAGHAMGPGGGRRRRVGRGGGASVTSPRRSPPSAIICTQGSGSRPTRSTRSSGRWPRSTSSPTSTAAGGSGSRRTRSTRPPTSWPSSTSARARSPRSANGPTSRASGPRRRRPSGVRPRRARRSSRT